MPNNIRRRFPGSQLRGVTPDVHRRLLTPAQPALILRCLDAAPLQGVGIDVQAVLPALRGNLCEILPRHFRLRRQDRLLNECQSFLIAQVGRHTRTSSSEGLPAGRAPHGLPPTPAFDSDGLL